MWLLAVLVLLHSNSQFSGLIDKTSIGLFNA